MWTQPAEGRGKKQKRLEISRTVYHYPSSQPDSRFAVLSYQAEGVTPTRRLVFIHGAVSHSGRHADMFEWLIRKTQGQLQVDGLDMVGHGLASGQRAHVENFSHWVNDFLTYLKQGEDSGQRTILMGHSMGGLIILKALLSFEQRIPLNCGPVILCNPCVRPNEVVELPKLDVAINSLADFLPTFRLPRVHRGPDLANNPEAANSFETDPLIPGFITIQMAREIWRVAQEVRPLSYFINRPTLFLLSDDDRVVDREATVLFSRGIDKKLVKVLEYSHTKHELLHEVQKQKVWQDILTWLESV